MVKLTTLNEDDLFKEVCDVARAQGINDHSGWKDIVDEVVEGHLDFAELDPDQNLNAKKEELYNLWEEYKRISGEESKSAVDEDPRAPHA